MPQKPSKCQISKSEISGVSPMRGISFIKKHWIEPKIVKTPDHKREMVNFYDETSLSKKNFYECNVCEGPLVPVSTCTFCKKATVRRCAKCNVIYNVDIHETCQNLVSYASLVSQKSLSIEI